MPKLSCQCGTVIELAWAVLRARAGYELACPVCGKVRRLPRLTAETESTAPAADASESSQPGTCDAQTPRKIEFEEWVEPPESDEPAPATVELTSSKLATVRNFRDFCVPDQNASDDDESEEHVPVQHPPAEFEPDDAEPVELAALVAASAAADVRHDEPEQRGFRAWPARLAGAWQAWKSKDKTLSSWGVSAAVHALAAVILALWMIPHAGPGNSEMWLDALIRDADDGALEMIGTAAAEAANVPASTTLSPVPMQLAASQAVASSSTQDDANLAPPAARSIPTSRAKIPQLQIDELPGGDLLETVALQVPRRSVADGGVSSAGGQNSRGALDGILAGLRDRRGEGDLKVVWLIDASISLHQDRQLIADRLDAFYKEQGKGEKQEHKFLSVAVSFGNVPRELVASTRLGQRVPAAIRNLQVDSSGLENVMSAIEFCVQRYRRPLKGLMQIIVWTDESGDDIQRLEETIQLCRKTRTIVSIVGPSSVLGSETGSHQYTDPGTGFAFLIPVKRGPDTSLPERIALPYWWGSPLPPRLIDGAVPAIDAPRYGGAYRERLMSGFGPYALTRLALETGGTFTILSRPGDPPEFPFETMKPYAPDYSSAADYLRTTQASPLRRSVSYAVLRTVQAGYPPPPQSGFGVKRDLFYPFVPFTDYRSPQAFRASLGVQLREQKAHATDMLGMIQSALTYFPGEGLDAAYSQEPSPRWKAWYDLTRGRLLAQSVRYREYLAASDRLLEGDVLKPDTNLLYLQASSTLLTGNASAAMASEAARCLDRCVRNHPGTPWELLAKWELDHGLGISWQEQVIPPPRPISGPIAPVASPPTISLPRL